MLITSCKLRFLITIALPCLACLHKVFKQPAGTSTGFFNKANQEMMKKGCSIFVT